MQLIPTTPVTINNVEVTSLAYVWSEMNISWADSLFSWDEIELQSPPRPTVITNLPTSNVIINNI